MFDAFYSTFATVSLTVTGLWMFIATVRFREWMASRHLVHQASAVSIQLAFPGIMCLFALIAPASSLLWRISFGVTSAAAAVMLVDLRRRSARPWAPVNAIGNWVAVAIFVAIALVAGSPEIVDEFGFRPVPRHVEFFLFCLLLLDGVLVAWLMLFAEHEDVNGGL